MSSLFCYAGMGSRYRQALSLPIAAAGLAHLILGRAEGMPWRFAGHDTVIAPGAVHDIFGSGTGRNPAWMAWLFSPSCCSDSVVAASSVLG